MAVTGEEVNVLPDGMDLRVPDNGTFCLNTYKETDAHIVRSGFGLLFEAEPSARNPTAGDWGAMRLLGCRGMVTDFDHVQTVAVYRSILVDVNVDIAVEGSYRERFVVMVYDHTDNQWWDEVLFVRTAERSASNQSLLSAMGAHTTNYVDRHIGIDASDKAVWFHEYQDAMLFGNQDCGIWCYRPARFAKNRDKSIDKIHNPDDASWQSESASVIRLYPVNGAFSLEYAYLGSDDFVSPSAAVSVVGRMAYAEGNRVYFSDIGKPSAIMGANVLTVPCDGSIVGLGEAAGALLIMTYTQTWIFRPALGTVASLGDLRLLSDSVGAVSAAAVSKFDSACVWTDRNGVFINGGDMQLQELSEPVRRMFTAEVASPLPHYDETSGAGITTPSQPRTFTRLTPADTKWAHIDFLPLQRMLIVSFPTKRRALVLSEGKWSLWTFASEMTINGQVQGSDKIGGLVLHVAGDMLLAWSSPETFTPADEVAEENNTSSSPRLYLWGRGGGVDGTSRPLDDRRTLAGWYKAHAGVGNTGTLPGEFVLGKPVLLPSGSRMPRGGLLQRDTYLFPLFLRPPRSATFTARLVRNIALRLTFDNTVWRPANTGTEIDFDVPPQRVMSAAGWGPGAVVPGVREVQTYLAGAPDASGDEIRAHWDGGVGGFAGFPNMAVTRNEYAPLLLLPMARIGTGDAMSLGLSVTTASVFDGVLSWDCDFYEYHQGTRDATEAAADDVNLQAIDWALKCPPVGLDEGGNFRLRTVYSRIMAHGSVADVYQGPYGEFNIGYGADGKDLAGQVVDFTGLADADKIVQPSRTIRARVEQAGSMVNRTFDNGVAWNELLVSGEQQDIIATSTSLKGESITVLHFGHLQSRASLMVVDSAKAQLQVTGQRRRKGR